MLIRLMHVIMKDETHRTKLEVEVVKCRHQACKMPPKAEHTECPYLATTEISRVKTLVILYEQKQNRN